MKEDFAIAIGNAAVDRVAAHHRDDGRILLRLVFPKDFAVVVQVERKNGIRERSMDIHDVADHERAALMSAQHAGRERPDGLKLADVLRVDLLQFGEPVIGIIPGLHHPVIGVLLHFQEFLVGRGRHEMPASNAESDAVRRSFCTVFLPYL